ncbi:sce7726 family protein [Serratia sp. NA_13]|uniref:sce7726 family protein n=1 Tax=Serratia sp. NA_13 TaxID=3415658 RepID=UPI004046F74A
MQDIGKINMIYAKAFRRPFFTSLAKGEDVSHVFSFFKDYISDDKSYTVREIFDFLFEMLRKNYRNEYVYKSAIINKIIFGRHSPKTSSSSIELHVSNSIVDVAVFNGHSTAYEIKTEFDSPKRLATQTIDYLDVFEKTYIVTHPDFADKYGSLNLPNVGVLVLSKKDSFSVIKEAETNLENIKLDKVFSVLRRDEYVSIIEDYISKKISMPNGLIHDFCKDVFLSMPLTVANGYFISAMKKRATDKDFIDYLYSLPASLRALGYATPLSKKQKDYLINLMDSKIEI